MARQQSYQLDRDISGSDRLLGTDTTGKGTVNISVEDLATYFAQTGSADPSRIGFSFNNAGVFTNNTLDSGEYRLQIAQGGTGFAHVTGIAISNSDRNGVNFLPESDILNGSILKLTGIEESGDVNYALYSVSDVTNITGGKLASVVHVSSSGNLVDNVATITLLSPNSTIIEGSQTVFAGNNTQYPNGPEGFIQAEEGSFFFYEVINGNETEIQIYGPKVGSDAHGWGESKKITPETINDISSSLDELTKVTTVTIHLSDGSEYSFDLPGGEKGDRGAQGVNVAEFTNDSPGVGENTTVSVRGVDDLTGNQNVDLGSFEVAPGAKGDKGDKGDQGIGVSDVSGPAGGLGQPTTVVVKGTDPSTGIADGVDLGSFTVSSGEKGEQGPQGKFDLEIYLVLDDSAATPNVTGGSYSSDTLTPPTDTISGETWSVNIPSNYDPNGNQTLWEARTSIDPITFNDGDSITWSPAFHAGNMGVQGFQGVNVSNFTSNDPGAGNDTTVSVTGTNPADPSSDPVDLGTFTVAPGASGEAAALDGDGIGTVSTVTTVNGEVGTATATITGDAQNLTFNFGIPEGRVGHQGIGELTIFRFFAGLDDKPSPGITQYDIDLPFSSSNGVPADWHNNVPSEVEGQDLYAARATYDPSTADAEGELTLHWSVPFMTGGTGAAGEMGEQGVQGISRVELYHDGTAAVPVGVELNVNDFTLSNTGTWLTDYGAAQAAATGSGNDVYITFTLVNPSLFEDDATSFTIESTSWTTPYIASGTGVAGPPGAKGDKGDDGDAGTSYSFTNSGTVPGDGNVVFETSALLNNAVPVAANVNLDGVATTDLSNVDSDLTDPEKTTIHTKLGVDAAGTVNADANKANKDLSNVDSDLTDQEKADFRTKIGVDAAGTVNSDANKADKDLGNVDSDLTDDEKSAFRTKIGAGTGGGSSHADDLAITGSTLQITEDGNPIGTGIRVEAAVMDETGRLVSSKAVFDGLAGKVDLTPTANQRVTQPEDTILEVRGSFDLEQRTGGKSFDFSGSTGDIHLEHSSQVYALFDKAQKKMYYDTTNTANSFPTTGRAGKEIVIRDDLTGYTPLNPSGGSGTTTDPAYIGTQTTNPGAFVPNNTGYMSEVQGENAHDGQDFLFTYTDPGQGADIWAVINLPNDLTNTHTVGFNYRDTQSGQIVVVTDFNTYAGSDYTTYTMSFGATVDIITHIS